MYSFSNFLKHLREKELLQEADELAGYAALDRGEFATDFLLRRIPWREEELKQHLASHLNIELFLHREFLLESKLSLWMDAGLSAKLRCLPLELDGKQLKVAVDDPFFLPLWEKIENDLSLDLEVCLILRSDFQSYYRQLYQCSAPDFQPHCSLQDNLLTYLPWSLEKETDELLDVLEQAYKEHATDIHFEPQRNALRVRFRIDGILSLYRMYQEDKKLVFLSRLKIWSELNIAQQKLPQDGQFQKTIFGEVVDFRLSTIPLIHGEKAVLRLLRKAQLLSSLRELGMSSEILLRFKEILSRPHGMILVCGPTASGKTTTLYSALQQLNRDSMNIVTIEDPVEFQLSGVQQMQIRDSLHATFATGLRAVLRQDPDVILIGEIRDHETAEVAFQAALTGHLVFASLHTEDAVGAIARLLDMGIEPFLLTSTISGILSQRLVRRICPECAIRISLDPHWLKRHQPRADIPLPDFAYDAGPGCTQCQYHPLKHRIGIFELLTLSQELRELILKRASLNRIREHAYQSDLIPFYWDGLEKARQGITALSEVLPYFPLSYH